MIVFLLLLLVVVSFVRAQKRLPGLPPGPLKFPLVGNMPQMGSRVFSDRVAPNFVFSGLHPHFAFPELAKTWGGLFSMQVCLRARTDTDFLCFAFVAGPSACCGSGRLRSHVSSNLHALDTLLHRLNNDLP